MLVHEPASSAPTGSGAVSCLFCHATSAGPGGLALPPHPPLHSALCAAPHRGRYLLWHVLLTECGLEMQGSRTGWKVTTRQFDRGCAGVVPRGVTLPAWRMLLALTCGVRKPAHSHEQRRFLAAPCCSWSVENSQAQCRGAMDPVIHGSPTWWLPMPPLARSLTVLVTHCPPHASADDPARSPRGCWSSTALALAASPVDRGKAMRDRSPFHNAHSRELSCSQREHETKGERTALTSLQ
jgi:hypothetical protein